MENEIEYDLAAEYIRRLTGDENTPVTFQVFDDTPAKDERKARIYHGTLKQHFDRLAAHNNDGCGIFCTVNETDLKGRRERNIIRVRAIPADDDDGLNRVDGFPLKPHMAVLSSHSNGIEKKHFYWCCDGKIDEYGAVINRLVQDFKTCAGAKLLNQVLRVPGFYHKKDPNNPQLVEIVHMTDEPPYPWASIVKAFPPINNGHKKASKLNEAFNSDPVLNHLRAGGFVKEECPDGKIHIVCPFEESHTEKSSVSSTTYFVAFTNGYRHGHFKCQHAHCAHRTREDFLTAIKFATREPGEEPGDETEPEAEPDGPPPMDSLKITADEWATAKLTPPCIVRKYLYCDVGCLAAPGGTGKTTLLLYEMICIVLGRPLYGLEIYRSGWCLYITSEDQREILIARLREVAAAMSLTADELRIVRGKIIFWDVTGELRPLIEVRGGNIALTSLADGIVSAYKSDPPVMATFDPMVSFGVSEGMVNDNGQGLITAGRRILRGLGCCVRFVAHTGIYNAQSKNTNQYGVRGGGSALVDGTRMTSIMQTWKPGDDGKPPPGITYDPNSSITFLSRSKLSYAPPNLPIIWIKRTGWGFEHVTEIHVSDEERERALFDQVERFLHSEVMAGVRHNKTSLETAVPGVSRAEARRAINQLIARGRVVDAELPKNEQSKSRKTYLVTSADFGRLSENGTNQTETLPEKTDKNSLPPPKEKKTAADNPPSFCPSSLTSAELARQTSADLADNAQNTVNISETPETEKPKKGRGGR